MNLFDLLNSDEATLGLSLLAAAGPRAQGGSFGQRLLEGMQAAQAQKLAREDRATKKEDREMARRLQQAQIGNYESEAAARAAKIAQQQQLQAALGPLLNAKTTDYSIPEGFDFKSAGQQQMPLTGAPVAPPSFATGQRTVGLAGADPNTLASISMLPGAPDLVGIRKSLQELSEPKQLGNGYVRWPDGRVEYMPKVPEGVRMPRGPGGPAEAIPGAAEYEATRQGGIERAKLVASNDLTLAPADLLFNGPGGPARFPGTITDALQALRGPQGANAPAGATAPTTPPQAPGGAPSASGLPYNPNANNPGAIRPRGGGPGSGFENFDTPQAGLAAIGGVLTRYADSGVNTLAGVMKLYAPSNENDTTRLTRDASAMLGIRPDQKINLRDPIVQHLVGAAILRQEGRFQWDGQGQAPAAASSGVPPGRLAGPADIKAAESRVATQANAENALNTKYAQDFLEWTQGGGADAVKSVGQLQGALKALKSGATISGPRVGMLPDWAKAQFSQQALDVPETILEVGQRNLRLILGAQFAQKEGEMLMSRIFNPLLDEKANAARLERFIKQVEWAARQKQSAAEYYVDNGGTLKGWKGKLPTLADFEPDSGGTSTTDKLPPAHKVKKGTRATNPDTGETLVSDGMRWNPVGSGAGGAW